MEQRFPEVLILHVKTSAVNLGVLDNVKWIKATVEKQTAGHQVGWTSVTRQEFIFRGFGSVKHTTPSVLRPSDFSPGYESHQVTPGPTTWSSWTATNKLITDTCDQSRMGIILRMIKLFSLKLMLNMFYITYFLPYDLHIPVFRLFCGFEQKNRFNLIN